MCSRLLFDAVGVRGVKRGGFGIPGFGVRDSAVVAKLAQNGEPTLVVLRGLNGRERLERLDLKMSGPPNSHRNLNEGIHLFGREVQLQESHLDNHLRRFLRHGYTSTAQHDFL